MGSDDPTGTGGPKWGVAVNVSVDDEAEAKRIYDALADGGSADMPLEATFWSPAFGSLTDRWGVSWQITPRPLTEAMTTTDPAVRERAFAAMLTMQKIDVAEIERAAAGA